jgi:hypothetical protein
MALSITQTCQNKVCNNPENPQELRTESNQYFYFHVPLCGCASPLDVRAHESDYLTFDMSEVDAKKYLEQNGLGFCSAFGDRIA